MSEQIEAVPAPDRQYSPDGQWWWDGTRWVPTAPPTFERRVSRSRVALLAGAALLLTVMVVGFLLVALGRPVGTTIDIDEDPELADTYCQMFPEDC